MAERPKERSTETEAEDVLGPSSFTQSSTQDPQDVSTASSHTGAYFLHKKVEPHAGLLML